MNLLTSLKNAFRTLLTKKDVYKRQLLEYENWEQLKKQIQALLPAHLPAEFDVGILTWEMFDGFSLSFIDWDSADFSWQWFDINGHKLGKEGQHA